MMNPGNSNRRLDTLFLFSLQAFIDGRSSPADRFAPTGDLSLPGDTILFGTAAYALLPGAAAAVRRLNEAGMNCSAMVE